MHEKNVSWFKFEMCFCNFLINILIYLLQQINCYFFNVNMDALQDIFCFKMNEENITIPSGLEIGYFHEVYK